MKKLNANQVVSFLKKNRGSYIKHYIAGGSVYDDEGNDCGDFSQKVLDNLIKGKMIKYAGRSNEFWSDGYYRLA